MLPITPSPFPKTRERTNLLNGRLFPSRTSYSPLFPAFFGPNRLDRTNFGLSRLLGLPPGPFPRQAREWWDDFRGDRHVHDQAAEPRGAVGPRRRASGGLLSAGARVRGGGVARREGPVPAGE